MLRLTLPALPVSASLARDRLRRWLQALRWPSGQLGDVLLAVSEAVSNSIEHAYRYGLPGLVEIEGRVLIEPANTRRVELTVRDHGRWRTAPPHDESRHRGIPLMRACMDRVSIDTTDHGTRITLRSRAVPALEP